MEDENKNENFYIENNIISKKSGNEEDYEEIQEFNDRYTFFYGNDNIQNIKNEIDNQKKYNDNTVSSNNLDNKIFLQKILTTICKINEDSISYLFELKLTNQIKKEVIGQIDFNSVIIRQYSLNLLDNNVLKFYYKYFQVISKIIYPTIQIFYGVIDSKLNNIQNFKIVLEFIPSNLEEIQVFVKKCLNGNKINYLILSKISEVLSYIYECGYAYLMLYPTNIKFNNKLFKQYFQVEEDSNYLYTVNKNYFSSPSKIFSNNFMKILNLGTYFKYKYLSKINSNKYDLKQEKLCDLCFFSPELIQFIIDDKINEFPEDNKILEKWDVYSFGCILFYLFYQKIPYFFCFNNNDNENIFDLIINNILNEKNFLETQLKNLKNNENENIPTVFVELIKECTFIDIKNRPNFNKIFDIINKQIEILSKDSNKKVNSESVLHDYSFYQLDRYNENLILTKEILTNKKLKNELNDVSIKYNKSKQEYINFLTHNN